MEKMGSVLRWGWLLAVALFAPATLPAGGGERRHPQLRRCERSAPLITCGSCSLHASPFAKAPTLRILEVGTPVHVLRCCQSTDGKDWLQVQVATTEVVDFAASIRRGWVDVGT